MPRIWNWYWFIQKTIGFLLEIVSTSIDKKEFLYQLIDTRMEGLWRNKCWILHTVWDIIDRDWQHPMLGILKELLLWGYVVRVLIPLFSIHNYLWMNMITNLKNYLMISITGKWWKNYMMLVEKTVISLLLMFVRLVMDAVCLSIVSFMLNVYICIKCYHVHT